MEGTAVSITDNIARHLVPGERFGNLPCRPFSGRTCSNFEMDQLAAIVTENDEYIEDFRKVSVGTTKKSIEDVQWR